MCQGYRVSEIQNTRIQSTMDTEYQGHRVLIIDMNVCWNSICWLSLIICWPNENKLPFFVSVCCKQMQVSHFRLPFAANKQKLLFLLVLLSIYTVYQNSLYIYLYIYLLPISNFKQEMKIQAIFLNPFTVYSSCKREFVVCPFADQETNGSHPFAKGLKGPAHLWY